MPSLVVPRLTHECTATDLTTHMGLMPQIERVWVSIDHSLFLWDYIDGCVRGL